MNAKVKAIEYYLPKGTLDNEELEAIYDGWSAGKIEKKTGIRVRHIAGEHETASDLGYHAAMKLFESGAITPDEIDFILFCSESPDYPIPPCACVLQDRLNIPNTAGALDFNLGCSGFVYGLGLAQGLIASGQAKNMLLITSETYSKYIHPDDKSVRTIFGDGAAATLITASKEQQIGPFVYGTDGSGFSNLIMTKGGTRSQSSIDSLQLSEKTQFPDNLFMNGPEIFNFTIKAVPTAINQLLEKAKMGLDDIDYFVFHQANKYMVEHLRQKIGIDKNKFFIDILETGNTVSASVPIALSKAVTKGVIKAGDLVLVIGYGVGYSWGTTLIRWEG
ncbi:3-oxoacyl-ACP synthase III family protein [Desulfoplanes formicivorans]|uniref:3-oxoacyl-ACP synthase n=1 Tax=Desulfoplanes formicivorans TaxID=1592317 RepID=A0A194AJ73_9BACT|nr:ketoacyl-ACP synthase III [Desulfoplanes formicivorans]GAU09373.1 3-oxoacyl-ACP synthase [Desulfoplanes formicivorans]